MELGIEPILNWILSWFLVLEIGNQYVSSRIHLGSELPGLVPSKTGSSTHPRCFLNSRIHVCLVWSLILSCRTIHSGAFIDHFYFVYCFCFKERVVVARSDDGHVKLVKPRVTKAKRPDTCLF